ncbi:MAG: hypothetical protein HDR79_05995 [Bacteroides sp.]|nr:hypothetical protein [Bacteroides sp.]
MDITKLASQAEEDALAEALEDKYVSEVSNRMRDIETINKPDMKRWVWELIQNAKDSIASSPDRTSVDIRFNIKGDVMEFSHNGAPFTHKARIALMYKHSSGKDNHQTTGRFGTGFLTTHRLSKIVDVKSNVIDRQGNISGFKLTLFRNGNSQDELREGLQKMRDSRQWIEPQDWTRFTYRITDDMGHESLKLGIESFHSLIASTMIFCPEIKSVTFDNNGNLTYISRGESIELRDGIKKIELRILNGDDHHNKNFLVVEEFHTLTDCLVAPVKMIVEVTEDLSIISHGDECGFFCSLPLEGIENQLVEPFIVNSESFESTTERQRLRLDGPSIREDGSLTIMGINKSIYSTILSLFKHLSTYLVEEGYKNLHFIVNGLKSIRSGAEELDEKWYKEFVQKKYREIVKTLPIVRNLNHEPVYLKDIVILKGRQDELALLTNLLVELYPQQLIEDNDAWNSVIWKDDDIRVWDIVDFCEHISSTYTNWNNIPNLSLERLIEWYNSFLSLVVSHDESLLKKYALLPDMKGDFHVNDENFRQNVNISTHALEILRKLGKDKSGELLHQDITALKLWKEYTSQSASGDINERVKEIMTQTGWLDKLLPLLSAIPTDESRYSNYPGFCEKRRGFLEIARNLYGCVIEEVEENSLIAESWREFDKNFVNAALKKLSVLGKLEALPNGLDASWLSRTLRVLNPSSEQWANFNLLPNQYGDFKNKEKISVDNGIEDILKSDILKPIGINPREYLLDSNIDAKSLGIEKIQTSSGIVSAIRNKFESNLSYGGSFTHSYNGRFYKYSQQTLLPIAKYITGLLPSDKESEHFKMQYDFVMAVDALTGGVSYGGMIGYTNSDLWTVPNMLIAKDLFETIKSDGSIDGSSKRLGGCGTKRVVELLNNLYHCLDALRINSEGAAIVPNQHGQYCMLSALYDESNEPDELLKDIAVEIPGGEDYRQVLIHPGIERHRGALKSNEEIASFVDNRVIMLFNAPLNWQDDQFRNAVTKFIESWGPEHKALFESLKTYNQKDAITVNVIITPEVRSKLQAIVRVGTDVSVIENAKENAERVKALEEENARLKAQLASRAIAGSEGERNDLTTAQRQTYLDEARKLVLEDLAKDGFDISDAVYDNTRIYGVKDCGGNNRPIVFRSNLSHRSTVISPEDWIILNQPGAMFGVVSEHGKVGKYNLIDMLKEQEAMTIRFSSSNLEWPHHLSEMTKVFHYFNGIQFDFERFISPTLERWQSFMAPELETGEQAGVNPSIPLPE